MKNRVVIDMVLDTYTEHAAEQAQQALTGALRATLAMFERNGIYAEGSAESEDGVRIRWTATREDTRQ